MEMELAPPPGLGLGDASAIAVGAKRARKRSRYLSPPYTDMAVPLDISAADVLSALLRTAARGRSPGHDAAQALHFLVLYRRSKTFVHSAAADHDDYVGYKPLLNLSTATGPAPTPAGPSKKKQVQKQKQNPPKPSSEIGDINASNSSTPPKRMRKNKKMMNDGTAMEHLKNLPPMAINNVPPSVPKLPLRDVRNNLEKMILSLNHRFSSTTGTGLREQGKPAAMGNLVGQMQGLLAKVDKMLQGGASSAVHHR